MLVYDTTGNAHKLPGPMFGQDNASEWPRPTLTELRIWLVWTFLPLPIDVCFVGFLGMSVLPRRRGWPFIPASLAWPVFQCLVASSVASDRPLAAELSWVHHGQTRQFVQPQKRQSVSETLNEYCVECTSNSVGVASKWLARMSTNKSISGPLGGVSLNLI